MISDFIPYGRQNIDQDDIDAVVEVLKSPLITQGPEIDIFEQKVAEYCGSRYAVAFNSGTSALHAAMFAADIGAGDEVLTSPMTFVASANAALYVQARPVFADIDPNTYCIDPAKIKAGLSQNTKAVVPVDYAGYPVDIARIRDVVGPEIVIIEDAAHALGARRGGRIVGCEADMTMFSFHPVKHITTGEGGIIVTDNALYDYRLRQFRNHGIVRDEGHMLDNHGPWYYEMQDLGYNYRMTSIQAALGISQLRKLESFIADRQRVAAAYYDALADFEPIILPRAVNDEDDRHAYHLYPILLRTQYNRRAFFKYLRSKNIGVQVHYIPVHLQPYYRSLLGCMTGDCPVAEDFYAREISLPIYPGLSESDQEYVIKIIRGYHGF